MSTSGARVMSMPPTWMRRGGAGSRRCGRTARASAPRARGRPCCRPADAAAAPVRRERRWSGSRHRPPPRPIACVGGAGGSQAYGRPRRSVRRSGGSRTPVSGSIARPSIVPAEVGGRMSVGGCRARPQPAHAGRRVARTAFVVREARAQRGHGRQTLGRVDERVGNDRSTADGARQDVADGQRPAVSAASRPGSMDPRPRQGPDRPRLLAAPAAPPGPPDATPDHPSPVRRARHVRGRAGPCRPPGHARRRPQRQRRCQEAAPGQRSPPSPPRGAEELGEAALRLEVAPDHDRVVGLERLGHPIDQRPREAQRVADLAHRRARPIGDDVADHARVLRRRSARRRTG